MTAIIDGTAGITTPAITSTTTPVVTNPTPQSCIRLNTANGYGSTNTVVRRFTNVVLNQGTDITYADSATLGASFTINTSGVYSITWGDVFSAGTGMAVTINDTVAGNVGSMAFCGSSPSANSPAQVAGSIYLVVGSIIRCTVSAATSTGTPVAFTQFTITRVS
jgi:hypothetical protein